MPGIVGVFSSSQLSCEGMPHVLRMCKALKHTPAQKVSTFRHNHLLLGRVDLGIFKENLVPKETEDLIAFIWGEFINPQRERKALLEQETEGEKIDDAEFLAGLFRKNKETFANCLRGSFNAFVIEKQSRAITIVNDRFGFRPLYYYIAGDELVFSSEVKGILAYDKVKKVLNPAGLAEFFHFGFITGEKTFFDGIESFAAGGTASFRDGSLTKRKYWSVTFTEKELQDPKDEAHYVHQLAAAIQESVEDSTRGGFRFGLPLSGGLDSRTIAACIPKDRYPVPTYTWGMPNSHEVQIARMVAQALRLEHHNLHRTPEEFVETFEQSVVMTDGMIPGNLPLGNFLYARSFASCADICLDGMQSISVVHPVRGKPLNQTRIVEQVIGKPAASLKSVLADPYWQRFKDLANSSGMELKKSVRTLHPINSWQLLDITQKQRRLDNFGVLVKRNFVEVRSPLFGYPVIDVIQRLPPTLRKQRYVYHKAFTCISPDLARIKNLATLVPVSAPHWLQMFGRIAKGLKSQMYQTAYEKLGIDYNRHKLCDWGIDYGAWYRESAAVRLFVERVLSKQSIRNCEFLNPSGVSDVLNAHFNGRSNYAGTINRLMTHVIWSRKFL